MEELAADAIVNREEPATLISIPGNDGISSDLESKRSKSSSLSSKLKEKPHDATFNKGAELGRSLQNRLFTKLLQQVIPVEDMVEGLEVSDKRSIRSSRRPGFSLPVMANNFRRFNARIGIVFVFQYRLIRLLSWKKASETISLLAICTFVCLDPYLLALLPVAGALLSIMVPAFLIRHPPPPPPAISQATFYSMNGPPLAPPRTIKPANEMSKDFFRNMRDLQNCMDDFSMLHDSILKYITPPTNFSNEPLSSTLFLFLFIASCALFIISHLLPWRFMILVACWSTVALGHPKVQHFLWSSREEHIRPHMWIAKNWLDHWIAQDVILDAPAETREVEIFELQRRKGGRSGEWEAWMFSPSPYDPLSPQRISGGSPRGTRFFEDVQPPDGWEWGDKKWVLDMASKEWVDERMVQGVEVEIEGERWVGDLLAQGLEEDLSGEKNPSPGKGRKRDWEEWNGASMMGEWRRRRWIRMVRRKILTCESENRKTMKNDT